MVLLAFKIDSKASILTQLSVDGKSWVNEPGPFNNGFIEYNVQEGAHLISWVFQGQQSETYQIEIIQPASAAGELISGNIGYDGIDGGNIKIKI